MLDFFGEGMTEVALNDYAFTTTNASWTNLTSIICSINRSMAISFQVIARRQDSDDCAVWSRVGLFKRDGEGNLTSVLTNLFGDALTPIKTLGATTLDIRGRLENDFYLYFDLKGQSGKTIHWSIRTEKYEIE